MKRGKTDQVNLLASFTAKFPVAIINEKNKMYSAWGAKQI